MTRSIPSLALARTIDAGKARCWLHQQRSRMVEDLSNYVSVETPSNNKACLTLGLSWITKWLTASLGEPATTSVVDGGEYGDTLIADYPGVGQRRLLILCHYDTVWDEGTLRDWPFRLIGSNASGPGVFDMKAGLIQAVWAARSLDAAGLSRPPLRFLLNGDEEVGSIASRPIIESAAADVAGVFVMEPSAGGAVKTSRKGVGIFRVDVHGVEAHAGLDPLNGASAIDEMARLVLHLRSLADLDSGTSINLGKIAGGSRSNVIAGHAWALLDVRVTSEDEASRIDSELAAVSPSQPQLRIVIEGGWNRPVMERTPAIAAMYELAKALADTYGLDLRETAAGGGSDGNFLAGTGIPLLDGLGPVGAGAHSRGEHVDLDAMPDRAAVVAALIHAFSLK